MSTDRGAAAGRPLAVAVAAGAAGAALALGALWASGQITSPAGAQDPPSAGGNPVTLSVAQLRINQRISQAAVRRSNESLELLDPIRPLTNQPTKILGWKTANLADGAVTGPKIADDAVTGPKVADGSIGETDLTTDIQNRMPMWATVNGAGALQRQRGATAATRFGTGRYRVTFGRAVNECSFTGTINAGFADIFMFGDPADTATIIVATGAPPAAFQDHPFTVHVLC